MATMHRKAEAYLVGGQPAEAGRLLADINMREPTPETRLREALAWLAAGDLNRAEEALARDKTWESPDGQLLLAMTRFRQGDTDGAQQVLDRYLATRDSDPLALALMADIAYRRGNAKEAIRYLQAADEHLKTDDSLKPAVLYNLALLHFQAGDFDQADASYAEYLTLNGGGGKEDRLVAGVLAYATRDHQRAAEFFESQDGPVRRELSNLLADESEVYASLAP
jgi:tetratricopeptide (TPR) repeat protein